MTQTLPDLCVRCKLRAREHGWNLCAECRPTAVDDMFTSAAEGVEAPSDPTCTSVSLAEVEFSEVEWLLDHRIAYSMLTAIYGDSGVGKSTLVDVLATAISLGAPFPDNPEPVEQGDVFIVSYEQLTEKVLGPRLQRMGADLRHIHIPQFQDGFGHKREVGPDNVSKLFDLIAKKPNTRAVIFDPIMSYVRGSTDTNMDNSVRGDLQPIVNMVEELNIAGIIVGHLNKKDSKAMYRASGSQAFINLPRSIFIAARHETTGQTALAHLLNNAGRRCKTLEYVIDQQGEFSWLGVNEKLTVEELLAPRKQGRPRGDKSAEEECASWLLSVVPPDEGVLSIDIEGWRHERGYTEITMKRAKKIAGIVSRRPKGGKRGWEYHRDDCPCEVCHEAALKEKTSYQRKLMNLNPEKFGDI